jgi:hypothetical protein
MWIEKGYKMQLLNEKGQKDKQRSTKDWVKHTKYYTKN